MTLDSLGRDWLAQATNYLGFAKTAEREGSHAVAIRQAQAAVELSLKAALRWAGVDHPREHDVADVLRAEADRFPSWFREKLESVLPASSELARLREVAMYGIEREARPPSDVFRDSRTVRRFLTLAETCHSLVQRLVT